MDIEQITKKLTELENENKNLKEQLWLYREDTRKQHSHKDAHSLIMECYLGGMIDMVWLEMLVGKLFKKLEQAKVTY